METKPRPATLAGDVGQRSGMLGWVEAHPALAHFLLAVGLGLAPISVVAAGLLPPDFNQLGALSGSAAGIVLAGLLGGKAGVRRLLGRGAIWRVGLGWWVFALVFPGLVSVVSLFAGPALGGPAADFDRVGSLGSFAGLLLFLVVFAGVGEEFGWRGFALPRTQARYQALTASLIVGTLHAIWHAPLFFIPGVSQYDMAQQAGLLPAFLGNTVLIIALGVQMSWIFNHTRGSVLMVALYHGSVNAWNGYIDIYRGKMGGVWAYCAIMVVVAVVITVWAGPANLSRTSARVTDRGG